MVKNPAHETIITYVISPYDKIPMNGKGGIQLIYNLRDTPTDMDFTTQVTVLHKNPFGFRDYTFATVLHNFCDGGQYSWVDTSRKTHNHFKCQDNGRKFSYAAIWMFFCMEKPKLEG
ncbi:hypothetical protein VHEMI04423 [[Torrubiella] hemipterigena]|uniref:Uncharacterized protein n=1 Tax=[Torrubiella] hemipterigena TaxID=1531966 RepID=A0A0A1TG90_9HYPO|nr:hypothetical protein VHEMI04423 [[Torrubiella] hemipterigena]